MAKVKRRDLLKAGAALAAAGTLGKGFAQEFYASPPTLLPLPGPPGGGGGGRLGRDHGGPQGQAAEPRGGGGAR